MNLLKLTTQKLLLLTLSIFVSSTGLIAQSLAHRQGEVLIEIPQNTNPEFAVEWLNRVYNTSSVADSKFKAIQVTKVPMNIYKLLFDFTEISESQVLRELGKIPQVGNAQLNHLIERRNVPNDEFYGLQWQFLNLGNDGGIAGIDTDAESAWDITTGGVTQCGDTIVACVIDDGIDLEHEDWGDNLWVNHAEIPNNQIDDDANGYVDDYLGWDVFNNSDAIGDGGSHGSSVAGIMGAQGNNEKGVSGVNWDVKLMIVKGGGDEADALASYAYPYTMRKRYNDSNGEDGAFVVVTNASWGIDGGQAIDAPLWCNFYDSLGVVGIVSCGATTNKNSDVDIVGDLPTSCSSDFLISVSNIDRTGAKVSGAGYGVNNIDIGAFGEDTYTLEKGNSYGQFGGTSAASPHVAGTVALAYSLPNEQLCNLYKSDPAAAALFVKASILESAEKDTEYDDLFSSGGRLNTYNALDYLLNVLSDCPLPINVKVEQNNLDSAIVTWTGQDDISDFNLRYAVSETDEWDTTYNATSPFSIVGVDICTQYTVEIQSICAEDSISSFSFATKFTTLGCCDAPSGLAFTNDPELVKDEDVFIGWDGSIEYDSFLLEFNLPSDTIWESVVTSETNYLLENIGFCQLVEVRISGFCITGEMSEYSEILKAVTLCGACDELAYCDVPTIDTEGEWIDSINVNGVGFKSGDDQGYANFSGFANFTVTEKKSFEFSLTKGFDDITFAEHVMVWIDFGIDGVFDEYDLVYDEGQATTADINEVIELDTFISAGYSRMRVAMFFTQAPVVCTDGTSEQYFGEVEDYCIRLQSQDFCDSGITIDSIMPGLTDANVLFSVLDTAIAYNVRFKKVTESEEDWNTISVLDTMASLSPLEECSEYVVQVRGVCPVDTSSFEMVSDTFMTLGCSVAVIDLEDLKSITINAFPNPFSGSITLELSSFVSGPARLEIVGVDGRVVFRENTNIQTGQNSLKIEETSMWSNGIYFVRLISGTEQFNHKIIKLE